MEAENERLYLLGFGVLTLCLLGLVVFLLQNLFGLVVLAGVGCGLGLGAESLYPSRFAHGKLQATGIGLGGALLGERLFAGIGGPALAGIHLVPAFGGAVLVSLLLRYKVKLDRARAFEEYKAQSRDDSLVNSLMGEYRLVKPLGSGAFARVYQAVPDRSLSESESVAVKVFNENLKTDPEALARIEREVQMCQKLDHPNIVKIHRSAQQDALHYLVMEFVRGETLSARMRREPLSVPEVCELMVQLSDALAHAHKQGIIHRDIKPDNILIGPNGPKVMDFGLARMEGASSLTQSGSALGTPYYMSPEQVKGEKNLDGRCDQYALGAVCFELLTRERLYEGEDPISVVLKHVQETPRVPSEVNADVPAKVSFVVLKMLSKNRDDRYPDMGAVAEAWKALV